MSTWAEGYVSDIPYSLGFYRETVPAHISFAATSVGASCHTKIGRVLDLGFGMGLGILVSAAANPHIHFEGVDFNPTHVAHAKGLAEEAKLPNVVLREASFQDLAKEAQEGQQDLDLIILHGILTWVSAEAQAAIVEIARKRLKAGGLLYVSYNCMPGWASVLPMQRLMRENSKRILGRANQQTQASLDLLKSLMTEEARFFSANPSISQRVDKMSTMDKNYLSHEYLNANWFIFHFADVAEMFARAKLGYIGSATLAENYDGISIPEGSRNRVSCEADPVFRETLRDFVSNKQFRRDIFSRGSVPFTRVENLEILSNMRFGLSAPRSKISFKFQTNIGEVEGRAEVYKPIADFLAECPKSFAEIADLPIFSEQGYAAALQALALLVHSGQVFPLPLATDFDPSYAHSLNRVLIQKARSGRFYNFLAAPLVGSGVQIAQVDLLILSSIIHKSTSDAEVIAEDVLRLLDGIGMKTTKDGKPLEDPVGRTKAMIHDIEVLQVEKLPFWRKIGVI